MNSLALTHHHLQEMSELLPKSEEAADVVPTVEAAINSLSQFLTNMHQEWQMHIEATVNVQQDLMLIQSVSALALIKTHTAL